MIIKLKESVPKDAWRTRPEYTISQAAKLVGTSTTTVRCWLYGSEKPRMRPVFSDIKRHKEAKAEVSFLQLAELVVVGRFRKRRVKLDRLRRAHDFARRMLEISHPFAWLKLKTEGAHVLSVFQDEMPGQNLLALDMHGQWTLPGEVIKALELFDYEEEFAARWYPIGKNVPIVIDPRFGAGKPTIPDRRLTIDVILKRWKAGQGMRFIASDFKLPQSVVETSLRYAENYAL